MEELWLGSQSVDLPIRRISQTFQVNDLADLKNRRLNFSNRFILPMTPKNIQAMNYLGLTGSNSRKPYQIIECRYVIDGVEIIVNGTAIVDKTDSKGYSVAVYSGNNELYDVIKDQKLSDLDWTALNHTQTVADYQASWSNTSGYIYAIGVFAESDTNWKLTANIEYQLPSVFLHTIVSMIFAQAGFTFSGAIFSDARYLNEVIAPSRGIVLASGAYDVDFSVLMGDMNQIDVIKDVMQCFGLIFRTVPRSNHYEFITMEELYNDRANAEDWTMKLTDKGTESYKIGSYAKSNLMTYKYEENIPIEDILQDGVISVDNENLNDETTLFSSAYTISKRFGYKNNQPSYLIPLLEYDADDTLWSPLECDVRKFTINRQDVSVSFRQGAGTIMYETLGVAFLSLAGLSYAEYIANYYPALQRIMNKQIKKSVSVYLSLVDVYNLDFFKLKYFSQFGQYYYLNKVTNWIKNQEVKVELVQVNELTENQPPNQLGDKSRVVEYGTTWNLTLSDFTGTSPAYNDPEFDAPETIKITSGFGNADVKMFNNGVEIIAETVLDANNLLLTIEEQGLNALAHSHIFEFTIQSFNNPAYSSEVGRLLVTVPVASNSAPIADAGPSFTIHYDDVTETGFEIADGTGSSDPDGDALTYLWTLEGAPAGVGIMNATGSTTAITADLLTVEDYFAQFILRLRVTDPLGLYSEDTTLVRIDTVIHP